MQVHRQRALLHRASMSAYADTLRERGFNVQQRITRPETQDISRLCSSRDFAACLADPSTICRRRDCRALLFPFCALEVSATPMLLTPDAVVEEHFNNVAGLSWPSSMRCSVDASVC